MKILIFLTFLMLMFTASIMAQDIVVTNDGNIIRGKVLKYSDEELSIKINEENTMYYSLDDIQEVQFSNRPSDLNKNVIDGFGVFGLTLGLPAGINLTGGYYANNFAIRTSLGVIPTEIVGFQLMTGYPIFANKDVLIAPSIPVGFIISNRDAITYAGIGLDTHIYGFTASISYGFGILDTKSDLLLFDIGYKYAWNN